jgi:hypothetical protein
MNIRVENLKYALLIAIESREKTERKAGYTGDSLLVTAMKQVVEAIERGERIRVVP